MVLLSKQKKFLLFAITVGVAGIIIGGIVLAATITNLLNP